jgi:hypothetical protein
MAEESSQTAAGVPPAEAQPPPTHPGDEDDDVEMPFTD